jgi:ABC-2 type transport system ATP-binding protein
MSDNALEVRGVSKSYKGFTLRDVSFTLPRGAIMGLIGPNGAGKTTIIKLIMNLVHRDGGAIEICGLDNRRAEAAAKERIGFVYDEPAFLESATGRVIARSLAPFYPRWDQQQFEALARELELPLGRRFGQLSQGMKTKLALALALAHDAELVVMDEPTAGLDPVIRRLLLGKLAELRAGGVCSVLFSTHITSDLERIADYITFVRDGTIVLCASRDELLERWGVVRGGTDLLDGALAPVLRGWRRHAFGVEALVCDRAAAAPLLGGRSLCEPATLEDIVVLHGRRNGDA